MTDGPCSQTDYIELKGFNAEIEEEKKGDLYLDMFLRFQFFMRFMLVYSIFVCIP